MQQNMGPYCCLNSLDLGVYYSATNREEIAKKIEEGGSVDLALNLALDYKGMKLLSCY